MTHTTNLPDESRIATGRKGALCPFAGSKNLFRRAGSLREKGKQMKFGHTVRPKDRKRIHCQVPDCRDSATVCLYGVNIGFYYHCDKHTAEILNRKSNA
jgi:hypothetical protein